MSFSDRIAELNTFDPSRYVPFVVDDKRVGSIRRDRIALLAEFPDVFIAEPGRVALSAALNSPKVRSEAVMGAVHALVERRRIRRLRGESYSVVALDDRTLSTKPFFEIDRAVVPFFGIRAFGVHVNGYVREGGGVSLWIAKRSATAHVHPAKLDNMVAGGQPASLSIFDNMKKESEEEASISESLANTAKAAGHISYCIETGEGLGPATMFIYDLELPANFVPENADGEIDYFELLPMRDVLRLVDDGREFKPNSNLVVLDFALRFGVIGSDHPDYAVLSKGLRQ